MKFTGKWMELEKIILSVASHDAEIKIKNLFTHVWILAVKSIITKLQFIGPQV